MVASPRSSSAASESRFDVVLDLEREDASREALVVGVVKLFLSILHKVLTAP